MKNKVHLIMPMAGAGSRFFKDGYIIPKPLIEINGKPFLYWATRSILKFIDVLDVTFVVLKKHVIEFKIDEVIYKYFKNAKIVIIPEVLNGAVLSCMEGLKIIEDNNPIIFNDCDHVFYCEKFNNYCNSGVFSDMDGALLTFKSLESKYSYLELDSVGNVINTVEKVVVSDKAICGAYYFRNKDLFLQNATKYLDECNYSEYYVSGVYNTMIKNSYVIKNFTVDFHLSFGTPEEYEAALNSNEFERFM